MGGILYQLKNIYKESIRNETEYGMVDLTCSCRVMNDHTSAGVTRFSSAI